jgi:hypothetical protein
VNEAPAVLVFDRHQGQTIPEKYRALQSMKPLEEPILLEFYFLSNYKKIVACVVHPVFGLR